MIKANNANSAGRKQMVCDNYFQYFSSDPSDDVDSYEAQVWSSYLTLEPDPQQKFKNPVEICRRDDISYVFPIASSCLFHSIPLRLFVDEENASLRSFLRSQNIKFIDIKRNFKSSNDERFAVYNSAIKYLHDDQILILCDCSDVFLKRNPFDYFDKFDGIVIGEDLEETPFIKQNKNLIDDYKKISRQKLMGRKEIQIINQGFMANAGVIGGRVKYLRPLLEMVSNYLYQWKELNLNLNMAAVNLAINQMDCSIRVGKPFTSGFKKFEIDSSYYVVHK